MTLSRMDGSNSWTVFSRNRFVISITSQLVLNSITKSTHDEVRWQCQFCGVTFVSFIKFHQLRRCCETMFRTLGREKATETQECHFGWMQTTLVKFIVEFKDSNHTKSKFMNLEVWHEICCKEHCTVHN